MKVVIIGRKVELKDSFKALVEKKLSRFDRMFDDNAIANVTVIVEKERQKVEITINHNGKFYRAEDTSQDMNESLDKVLHALTRQFRKNKTKLEKRFRQGSLDQIFKEVDIKDEDEKEYDLVRTKKFPVKPISLDEAILELNMIGHSFYIFRNEKTNEINVVYKRRDGKYGVLVPDDI
ncbi:MAG: ribosome-associated translation inhibitor RaiA [Clostridia bacterium]|nr:ribosome-associated translation inhibitor RaiA [Clostridia bacterium]